MTQPTFKTLLQQGKSLIGQEITFGAWARSVRKAEKGSLLFLQLTDGSCHKDLQVIVRQCDDHPNFELLSTGNVGWSFRVTGTFVDSGVNEKGEEREQAIELVASSVEVLGTTSEEYKTYPLQKRGKAERKKGIPMERFREIPHLRGRSYLFSAIFRLRNSLAMATHSFFQSQHCMWVSSPLITFSDCEGAGEAFIVTTDEELQDIREKAISSLQKKEPFKESLKEFLRSENPLVNSLTDDQARPEESQNEKEGQEGQVLEHPLEGADKHFFHQKAYLTVSGQLEGEAVACGMTRIYTFGPTFRAEKSKTTRHLSEFWMVEPELAFISFEDLLDCAENYVQHSIRCAIKECKDEILYLEKAFGLTSMALLEGFVSKPFVRISYTEAVELLQKEGMEVQWGDDLCSDFEKHLTDVVFKHPVIVSGYPTDLKAFYMKPDKATQGKTVDAFDLLVPTVGELIGGSMREEDYKTLVARMTHLGMDLTPYKDYLELREYGTVPHGGYGLGFERLVKFVGGIPNIKDTIFFPRSY